SGHHVVLGTAGTGKTVMATLRAQHLASPTTPGHGRVLLVTYNNALVTYLRHLHPGAPRNITIETYGRFARGYLKNRGQMPGYGLIAKPTVRRHFVERAIDEVRAGHRLAHFLGRDPDFF